MKRAVIGMSCAVLLATAGYATARTPKRALAGLLKAYWSWALGAGQPDHLGEVVFVPVPPTSTYDPLRQLYLGETTFTVKAHDPVCLPSFVVWGNRYRDGTTPDDSPGIVAESDFTNAEVWATLDGRVIVDGDDLDREYVDTQYFAPPLLYPASPSNEVAAVWIKGLVFRHRGLSKGSHTVTLHVSSPWLLAHNAPGEPPWVGWENTWHFTVTR